MSAGYASADGLGAQLGDDAVLRLTIQRAERRGSIDDAVGHLLIDHLVAAGQDEGVRAILLRSDGADFCAGSDLAAKNGGGGQRPTARPRVGSIQRRLPSTFHRLIPLLLETQVPVVAAVRGWAAGLGFHLAVAADFCVAATGARFWEPFMSRGFTPDSGATWLLPRLVGLARARELVLLGRELSGEEAAAWGLIHAAVADDQIDAEAEALAVRLAGGPTVALGLAKWLLAASIDTDLASQLRNESFALELSSRSEDFREGLAAFRDKRTPEFGGR
jgi:2-(1,2-epoxy-1,2-dihydrophenyl)acetyl-CoA isomerase